MSRVLATVSAIVAMVSCSSAAGAHADRVAAACRALSHDPSLRVRAQAAAVLGKLHDERAVSALVGALADDSELVRALAAQALSDLGGPEVTEALARASRDPSDLVRKRALTALARRQPGPDAPPGLLYVTVGGIGNHSDASPALTRRLRGYIVRELLHTPGVSLAGKPQSGLMIDSAITELSRRITGPWLEISCEVSLIVGRLPSRAMLMMTSGGATVQAPRQGLRPEAEAALEASALENAVHGAHQNLLAFLKTVR